ncbi:MAG: bifunctional UDP-N-acetylglucosamine diphosphorylase/glucosamine-1-phosphate N-acetyltransferase GlmU [Campylobacterota bacterium]
MALSTVILAAGFGTRMKSDTPKVLHTISGEAMIFHTIKAAKAVSDNVTVVLYHQHETVRQAIENRFEGIDFVLQDVKNYPGTGGALKGLEFSAEEVLIINGDMPLVTPASLQPLIETKADIVMSVLDLKDAKGYGRVVIEKQQVKKIVEQKDCDSSQLALQTANAGVYKVKKELLDEYIPQLSNDNAGKEYYLTDIIEMGVCQRRTIKPAFVSQDAFKGVNSKLDLAEAEVLMQERIKKQWMQQGVIMHLPQTIYIDCNAVFEGECELESGVSVFGASRLVESCLKTGTVVEDATLINSKAGPYARIRPKSTLRQTQIGNFVETKKAALTGVKAGHLSYLGDCEIDAGTNIGAGVITCNYDGKNKYKTVIGKNVFVGSDCQLVAPVVLEDDTMVAAGTTLNKDVTKGSLAISRPALKQIKNFFYKFFK